MCEDWVGQECEEVALRTLSATFDVNLLLASCPAAGSKCPLGSAPARILRLLSARLSALERPAHWVPSHCLGCSS